MFNPGLRGRSQPKRKTNFTRKNTQRIINMNLEFETRVTGFLRASWWRPLARGSGRGSRETPGGRKLQQQWHRGEQVEIPHVQSQKGTGTRGPPHWKGQGEITIVHTPFKITKPRGRASAESQHCSCPAPGCRRRSGHPQFQTYPRS